MRQKGELSPAAIDRGWPHQIVLPARRCECGGYEEILEFCKNLTLCSRGHAVFHDREWFQVYCFQNLTDADKFLQKFAGERFYPEQRGEGQ